MNIWRIYSNRGNQSPVGELSKWLTLSELSKYCLSEVMSDISRGERLQIMLSPEELAIVDDFRFRERMPSRAAAVRELLKLGLTSVEAEGSRGTSRLKSSDYGVFDRGADGHRPVQTDGLDGAGGLDGK